MTGNSRLVSGRMIWLERLAIGYDLLGAEIRVRPRHEAPLNLPEVKTVLRIAKAADMWKENW